MVNFKGREKMPAWWSDAVIGVTESAEVLQDLVKTWLSWLPAWWIGGEGVSVRSNVEKKSMNPGNVEVTQDNQLSAIARGAVQEGVHLIKEVTARTRRAIYHHNVEFERKGDRDSVEFKSRCW